MPSKLIPSPMLLKMTLFAVLLPVTAAVLMGLARLFHAMGDAVGSRILDYVALGVGVLWVLDLLSLLLAMALNSIISSAETEETGVQDSNPSGE